jgi:hypothetical protein
MESLHASEAFDDDTRYQIYYVAMSYIREEYFPSSGSFGWWSLRCLEFLRYPFSCSVRNTGGHVGVGSNLALAGGESKLYFGGLVYCVCLKVRSQRC